MPALNQERFTLASDDTLEEVRNGAKISTSVKERRFSEVCGRLGAKERA